jgi:predicted HicB family RNase H-like nuclease
MALTYKGYTGKAAFDEEAGLLHGEVVDIKDVITFEAHCVEALEDAFRESVDDYLAYCEKRGEKPDKPFTGRLTLRLTPELHRKAYIRARREGKSLNQWISDRLADGD